MPTGVASVRRRRVLVLSALLLVVATARMALVFSVLSGLGGLARPDGRASGHAWLAAVLALPLAHALTGHLQGVLGLEVSARTRERLFTAIIHSDVDSLRALGASFTMVRVLEAEAVETLAWGPAALAAVGTVGLGFCTAVLADGAGGAWIVALVTVTAAAHAALTWAYVARLRSWATARSEATRRQVEQLLGHHESRAALRCQRDYPTPPDAAAPLAKYEGRLRACDRYLVALAALPRCSALLGTAALVCLAPAGELDAAAVTRIAGGLMLVSASVQAISAGTVPLARAKAAWPRLHASAESPDWLATSHADAGRPSSNLLEAEDLVVAAGDRLVHGRWRLEVGDSDHMLLSGRSGSGKSLLVDALAGERRVQGGRLLRARRQAYSPSDHGNHVFQHTLRFNLLMGRSWPPSATDEAAALAVCDAVGLLPLVARMPSGLDQVVGEAGWQLSNGERSRLFLARCLLAGPDLLLLDETLESIDREGLHDIVEYLGRHHCAILVTRPCEARGAPALEVGTSR